MQKKLQSLICVFTTIAIIYPGCGFREEQSGVNALPAENKQDLKMKPYRVLIVIGDQWKDPMSYHIDPERVEGADFLDVVSMLKIWGIPFDILRLDEQRLQINRFLDGVTQPRYGSIIWMADPEKLIGYSANFQTLHKVVNEYGISMIALFDHIRTREIASLVGVDYKGVHSVKPENSKTAFTISGDHYLTEGAVDVQLPHRKYLAKSSIPDANGITFHEPGNQEDRTPYTVVDCTIGDSATTLGSVGSTPQFTVRDVDRDTKVIWIGGGRDWFRKYPVMRRIFRKSLVYSIGYGLFNDNFKNGFIFIMDDIGASEHAWSLRWHYPTPQKDTLIKYLIEPLEQYGLMMVQMITPGYANPLTKMIESPWTIEPFEDIFGNWQDYGSTKEGLDEGLRRGVFEIQAHRAWSHMNWDLDSPPGPWWGSPFDGEIAVTDWYNEVVDVRRGHRQVPSNDLLFIYRTGIDAIKKSFGVVPLAAEVRTAASMKEGTPGGYDNGRVAAIAGLGVSRECYVGFEHTIEFSMMMPEQFTCHDLDLTARTGHPADRDDAEWDLLNSLSTKELMSASIAGGRRINLRDNLDWIESRLDKHWMGFNETCAYLHSSVTAPENNGMILFYDDHYCRYFENNQSFWTLELSEWFFENLGGGNPISINGHALPMPEDLKQVLEFPAGLGVHHLSFVGKD